MLEEVVVNNDKKRFVFSENKRKIRASQGHSIEVDLGYASQTPPEVLYHGTATHHIDAILKSGLERRKRKHVHLSADRETAIKVGERHGNPVVFEVATAQMHAKGYVFYFSENGVWLTDAVPAEFLRIQF